MSDNAEAYRRLIHGVQRDATPPPRKVVQLLRMAREDDIPLLALCNDGTIWGLHGSPMQWTRLADIPQGGA